MENNLIQSASEWATEYNESFIVSALIFDGMHVSIKSIDGRYRPLTEDEASNLCDFLAEKSNEIYKINMKWSVKAFDHSAIDDIMKDDDLDNYINHIQTIRNNVKKIASSYVVSMPNGEDMWMCEKQLK
eukprot:3623741-Pleurochrysis_carterae.AAC.1